MVKTPTPERPFQSVIIDTIGPFPTTFNHYKYAVTIICDFSKFLIIVPIPNKEAKTIAKTLMESCILVFGPIQVIRSDLGTEYANSVMKELSTLLDIKHYTSTAYHHQTVGTVERSHRTLNEYLRNYINENSKSWAKFVKYFAYCFNTTPNTAINMYCPFELVYGRAPASLITNKEATGGVCQHEYINNLRDFLEVAYRKTKEFIECNKNAYKRYYDKNCKAINYYTGEKILLVNTVRNKLDPYYKDNFEVVAILDNNKIRIKKL